MARAILSLCDLSGVWSQPYAEAGYEVTRVDLEYPPGEHVVDGVRHIGADVRVWEPTRDYHGVLAAPPCCCFSRAGARWWPRQDSSGQTETAVQVLKACLRLSRRSSVWWALENPPGRHLALLPELGGPSWQFQPYQYGDMWSKQTFIWGTARRPPVQIYAMQMPTVRAPSGRTQGRMSRLSSRAKGERARTPPGFAQAFFEVNP